MMAEERPAEIEALEERIDALEDEGRYDEAIAALAQLRSLTGDDERWHVAWMHVRAGRRAQADALWAALERESPGDPTPSFLAGSAHAEAGEPEAAAQRFERALQLALTRGTDGETLRRIMDARGEALRASGLPAGPVDEAARRALARAAAQGTDLPVATPFLPAGEFAAAVAAWPEFAADWADDGHAAYALELDRRMRAVAPGAPRRPVVVPLTVADITRRADALGLPADAAEARARAAYDAAQEGRGLPWPPGRNDPCWCGSGSKYKRCCGR
jgi:tetratricopeptide (TPR) repeat protein